MNCFLLLLPLRGWIVTKLQQQGAIGQLPLQETQKSANARLENLFLQKKKKANISILFNKTATVLSAQNVLDLITRNYSSRIIVLFFFFHKHSSQIILARWGKQKLDWHKKNYKLLKECRGYQISGGAFFQYNCSNTVSHHYSCECSRLRWNRIFAFCKMATFFFFVYANQLIQRSFLSQTS